jgi:TonB family protein
LIANSTHKASNQINCFGIEGFDDKISLKAFYIDKYLMKKLLLTFLLSIFFCSFSFGQEKPSEPEKPSGSGSGSGSGFGSGNRSAPKSYDSTVSKPLNILFKPRPRYTEAARQNEIEGDITLRITFLDSGQIGSITPVSELPFGLTEQAIAAAKQMRFEPQIKNGRAVTVIKPVQFSFTIYYDEDYEAVAKKAEIIEMPEPEFPQEGYLKNHSGKVMLEIALNASGKASVVKVETDLPKEFIQSAREAVSKITFKPAIHKNGREISVTRVIKYEFKSQN